MAAMPLSSEVNSRTARPWVARSEQAVLVLLALAVVSGVAWRAVDHWRIGAEPLEIVPPPDGPTYRVNVNVADWVTLALVPGIGEKSAKKIVAARESRGGRFASLDDLREVDGIGEKTLAKLRPYLFLDEPKADDEPIRMLDDR